MTVIRNIEGDLWRFRSRALVASLFILFLFVVLLARLFYLQIVRYDEFRVKAEGWHRELWNWLFWLGSFMASLATWRSG